MDLFRPRAIPALIAGLAIFTSHAACEALNGTYRYESTAPVEGLPRYLSDLTQGPERSKLMKQESAGKAQGFASAQPRSRPKVTHLATTGTLAAQPRGATIEFRDAQGKVLAKIGIGAGWSCKGDQLERHDERTAGLGENVRTERIEERLAKAGNELVYTETVTNVGPPGGKPKRTEIRYAGK